jgi:hypothetical protein
VGIVTDFVDRLWNDAESYGVRPLIFVTLYLVTWPFWYYTMWRVVSGWHRQDYGRMRHGIWANRVVTVIPYAYVLLAGGDGMPWTWYAFALILPILTTSWFLHKVQDEAWMAKWWDVYVRQLGRFRASGQDWPGSP